MAALTAAGLSPQVTSVVRSYATQKRLYDTYRQGKSRYPAAPPGYSAHEQGWAFDLQLNDASWLADAGDLWESWGGTWGGRFNDPIHFELGGASAYLKQLLDQGYEPPTVAPTAAQPPPSTPTAGWYDPNEGVLANAAIDAARIGNAVIDVVF